MGPDPSALTLSGPAQPCHADPQDPGQGPGGAPKPTCLQDARHQLRQQGGKQHVRLAVAAAAAGVPSLELPFQPLSFDAACVWFWATVRRLVLSLPAVAHKIEPKMRLKVYCDSMQVSTVMEVTVQLASKVTHLRSCGFGHCCASQTDI